MQKIGKICYEISTLGKKYIYSVRFEVRFGLIETNRISYKKTRNK